MLVAVAVKLTLFHPSAVPGDPGRTDATKTNNLIDTDLRDFIPVAPDICHDLALRHQGSGTSATLAGHFSNHGLERKKCCDRISTGPPAKSLHRLQAPRRCPFPDC
jgi:hypothetical protein